MSNPEIDAYRVEIHVVPVDADGNQLNEAPFIRQTIRNKCLADIHIALANALDSLRK